MTTLESLAHELRQPLSAILSNAQAAQRLLDRRTAGEVSEILEDIVACDKRAAAILRRLEDALRSAGASGTRDTTSGTRDAEPSRGAISAKMQGEQA